jgi:chorismate mutase
MAKTKSVVKSAAFVELETVRAEMKTLRERAKFLMAAVAMEKSDAKLLRASAARARKAETIAKLKEKLAALEAA